MRRIVLVGVIAVLGAALAGCGDDDSEAMSEDAFLEQGNAICEAGSERTEPAFNSLFEGLEEGEELDPEKVSTVMLDVIAPSIEQQIDELGALEPPEELAEGFEQFLEGAQAAVDQLEQATRDDPATVFQDEDPFIEVSALADEIGLSACADDEDEDAALQEAAADIVPDPDNPYCDVEREVDAIFEEEFSALTEDSAQAEGEAASQAASQRVIDGGFIERGEAIVPDVIRADFELLVTAVHEAAEGNFESFQDEHTDIAGFRVDTFCGQLEGE